MEYLIRLAQIHESFRQPEVQAVATLLGVDLEFISYEKYVSNLSSYPALSVFYHIGSFIMDCHARSLIK